MGTTTELLAAIGDETTQPNIACRNITKHFSAVFKPRRHTLTMEEAAGYYPICEGKLRSVIDAHPQENFYVMSGNRVLTKRAKFGECLDQATAV